MQNYVKCEPGVPKKQEKNFSQINPGIQDGSDFSARIFG